MENFLTYGAIGIAISALMYFLTKESKKLPPVDEEGNKILKLPLLYGLIGILVCVAGVVVLGFGIFKYSAQIGSILVVLLIIGGLGGLLVLMAFVAQVKLTEKGIEHKNMLGTQKSLSWESIQSATFNSVMLELKISDGNQQIKCHYHLKGFDVLVDNLIQKSGLSKGQMGLP